MATVPTADPDGQVMRALKSAQMTVHALEAVLVTTTEIRNIYMVKTHLVNVPGFLTVLKPAIRTQRLIHIHHRATLLMELGHK